MTTNSWLTLLRHTCYCVINCCTGISGQEGRIYDCSPPANISKFEFSRDVSFNLRARFHNSMTLQIIISSAAIRDRQKFKSPMLRAWGQPYIWPSCLERPVPIFLECFLDELPFEGGRHNHTGAWQKYIFSSAWHLCVLMITASKLKYESVIIVPELMITL